VLPHPTTHRTLLARLADVQDQTAWRDFHDRYVDLIRGYGQRRGLPPASSDDLVQEVLLALRKSMPGFTYDPARGAFRGYLKAVVGSIIHRRFRQNDSRPCLPIDECTDSSAADNLDQHWELEWQQYHIRLAMRMIETEFGPADRAAFQAYAVEGRDAAQTAATLGLSPEQVYQAKSRILRRLRDLIESQVREEG
jgi:RNA polymerase sigma-70 factor (ECF subfamily)